MTEELDRVAEEQRVARTEAQRRAVVAGATEASRIEEKPEPPPQAAVQECWKDAVLSWNPGTQTIAAVYEGKKATVKGKDLVPLSLHKNLFDKRKAVKAEVTVEKLGNAFVIRAIKGE
jgi:hypothetical protein